MHVQGVNIAVVVDAAGCAAQRAAAVSGVGPGAARNGFTRTSHHRQHMHWQCLQCCVCRCACLRPGGYFRLRVTGTRRVNASNAAAGWVQQRQSILRV